MEPSPAVVIVSHQTRDEVLGCLASLADCAVGSIVVVDTGSTDGTVASVRRDHPQVQVIELANAGFGRAANAGVRVVDSQVVVIANADVRFERGSVIEMQAALASDPGLAVVGPTVRYPDGSPQASARSVPDLPTALGHAFLGRVWPRNPWTRRYRLSDLDPGRPRDVDWVSGCAMAVRRDAFESVGGFDPGYHLYVEDLDLGVRLRAAGWRLRFLPAAVVTHRVGASTGRRRGWALRTHARSLQRFHRRHYGGRVAALLRPVLRVGLAGWVVVTWVADRLAGPGRSPTGERLRPEGPAAVPPTEGSLP